MNASPLPPSDVVPRSEIPRAVVKKRRAMPFFSGHPWVYEQAIERIEGEPGIGDAVALYSHEQQFIAYGLYNPHSKIRIRLYSWQADIALDVEFWSRRFDEAIRLRQQLFDSWSDDAACRLIYSEGDGLSGLVVERYGDWLSMQFTSRAMAERQELFVRLLREQLSPRGIWLRTEKGMAELEGMELQDQLVFGEEPPRPLFIEENGLRYGVDVVQGQKTGFYLDQRDNRTAVARYVRGHRVLDLFCYTGGFGLTALVRGGASSVLGIDVSEPALVLARANAELNGVADRIRFEKEKAFDALERLRDEGKTFDTVILDPPKLARNRKGLDQALRGYFSLNRLAVDLLPPGGLLVTCSCSGHVTREDFEEMLATVASRSKRRLQILESRGQSPDHPVSVSCPESAYLKCIICRVL